MTAMILGLLVGAVMGLTGAGGGILAVPALVFGLGWTLTQAAPLALLAAATAGLVGALEGLKRGILRYRAAIVMAAVGVCVTPLGVRVAQAVPQPALLYTFAAVLTWVAVRTFNETRSREPRVAPSSVPCRLDPRTGRLIWTPAAAAILGLIGAVSGFLAGLLGVGGGFVIVPALRRASDLGMHSIVTTSLAVIALVASGAVAASLAHGATLPAEVAWPFVGGAVAGMFAGRAAIHRLPARRVQQLFAAVTLVAAAALAARAAGIFPGA